MAGKILVVDDVATNRIILKAKLGIACYDVIQAADGRSALAIAEAEHPDLILLDLAMPGGSGLDALKALKARATTADIPVVIVTSRIDARTRIAALAAGAEDFLTKPVDDMILAARVRSLLRTRLLSHDLDLRDETRRALGFSEAQAPFSQAAVGGTKPGRNAAPDAGEARAAASGCARGEGAPGRIALIDMETGIAEDHAHWLRDVSRWMPHPIQRLSRTDAMRMARGSAPHDAAPVMPDGVLPEVFVIRAGPDTRHDGMMLLSELRAGPGTCHAAILMAIPASAHHQAAMSLDLGASDVLTLPLEPEEAALRLSRQLHRSRRAIALRRQLRDGLQLAVTDPLTGLPNRRYGLSHLERMVERALDDASPLAAVMLDLDRFKNVNDLYGHAAGDAVLRNVATRLLPQLRAGDLLARIGGEEFLVILPRIPPSDAARTAERLRRAVDAIPIPLPPPPGRPGHCGMARRPRVEIHQTVSVGLACGPVGAERQLAHSAGVPAATAALLERADAALLRAKAGGRNRVVVSTPGRRGERAA